MPTGFQGLGYRLALACLFSGFSGGPALAQDGIASLLMNAERPLIDKEAAKKIARIVIETHYDRESFIPSHRPAVDEEPAAWRVTFKNENRRSDLYELGFRTATLRIAKKDGAILSISR